MDIAFVIPGIMGSALSTPEGTDVWPPTPTEAVLGYKRVDELVRKDLEATRIIDRVCVDVYGSLLNALDDFGYTDAAGSRRIVPFAYDWRRNLLEVADDLDKALEHAFETHPAARIRLLCHSMGGLLARVCLERPRPAPPWMASIDLCVFMATPHEGAPLAVSRASGIGEGSTGLNPVQLRKLSGQPGYPAGYQLFPFANLLPVWKLDSDVPFEGLSVFDDAINEIYGLNPASLNAARAVQAILDHKRRPAGCRYFSIVSAFHETTTRFNLESGRLTGVSVASSGDGTVPIRSASALPVQTVFVRANHMGVAQDPTTHEILGMLLGVTKPAAVAASFTERADVTHLSVSQSVVTRGESFEVVLAFGSAARKGRIAFVRETDAGPAEACSIQLDVSGPSVRQVIVAGPDLAAGVYKVHYETDVAVAAAGDLVVMQPSAGN